MSDERSIRPSYPRDMRNKAKREGRFLCTIDVPGLCFKGPVSKKEATEAIEMVTWWLKAESNRAKTCPDCGEQTDGSVHKRSDGSDCLTVLGRRGWRHLGDYDG